MSSWRELAAAALLIASGAAMAQGASFEGIGRAATAKEVATRLWLAPVLSQSSRTRSPPRMPCTGTASASAYARRRSQRRSS